MDLFLYDRDLCQEGDLCHLFTAHEVFHFLHLFIYFFKIPCSIIFCCCKSIWLFSIKKRRFCVLELLRELSRSSRSQMFFKIGVLRNFAMFTGKHLCWSLFLIKLQAWRPASLFERDSNTGFSEELFKQATSGGLALALQISILRVWSISLEKPKIN